MRNFLGGLIIGVGVTSFAWSFMPRQTVPSISSERLSIGPFVNESVTAPVKKSSRDSDSARGTVPPASGESLNSELNKTHEAIPDEVTFANRMHEFEREVEDGVGRLWKRDVPQGRPTSRVAKPDGSVVEIGQTDKGDVVSRQFKEGNLLALEWKTSGGKFLIKTYNSDGTEKGISVGTGDRATYTFISDLQGRPTYKEYTNKDGSKYIARYENGRTTEQWYVTRDGRYLRIN